MKNDIYVVTLGVSHEGPVGQWIFSDEPSARAKFDEVSAALKAREVFAGDHALLAGPFVPGEDILRSKGRELAWCE